MRSGVEDDTAKSPLLSEDDSNGDNDPLLATYDGDSPDASDSGIAQTSSGEQSRGRGFWLAWVGFFVLGTVNNLPYVIVSSAADAIVKRYCVENLIGGERPPSLTAVVEQSR